MQIWGAEPMYLDVHLQLYPPHLLRNEAATTLSIHIPLAYFAQFAPEFGRRPPVQIKVQINPFVQNVPSVQVTHRCLLSQ
ncbi:hypothetical protein VE00_07653 [Pseudogymnoascus sp. WSF 3629]|nr:hypothetical protein VE00_07653 [Pseudogymnoascus sp. WSF 3629]